MIALAQSKHRRRLDLNPGFSNASSPHLESFTKRHAHRLHLEVPFADPKEIGPFPILSIDGVFPLGILRSLCCHQPTNHIRSQAWDQVDRFGVVVSAPLTT